MNYDEAHKAILEGKTLVDNHGFYYEQIGDEIIITDAEKGTTFRTNFFDKTWEEVVE